MQKTLGRTAALSEQRFEGRRMKPTAEQAESAAPLAALSPTAASISVEHLLEHVVLAELAQEAWFGRGRLIDVLHSSVDAFGHDVVLECGSILRHLQFKARRLDGRTSSYKINSRLAERPSGCVVWIGWKAREGENRVDVQYRWFSGLRGEPLPELGDKVAKNAKAIAQGVKLARPGIRMVTLVGSSASQTLLCCWTGCSVPSGCEVPEHHADPLACRPRSRSVCIVATQNAGRRRLSQLQEILRSVSKSGGSS